MFTSSEIARINSITQMILEMANGNFSCRIKRSNRNDEIEQIAVNFNMLAEELQESFHHFLYVNPHETYRQVAQATFILDSDFRIKSLKTRNTQWLGIEPSDLEQQDFVDQLVPGCRKSWAGEIRNIRKDDPGGYCNTLPLVYRGKNDLIAPLTSAVATVGPSENQEMLIFVTALDLVAGSEDTAMKFQAELAGQAPQRSKDKNQITREIDIRNIQKVYDYVLHNFDEQLPSLPEIAHEFCTNEFKLKKGFRQLYKTSVFRLQTDQRLRKAHIHIRTSDMPLNAVADICGFKSYPHFSKAFKKMYGYNPSDLQKKRISPEVSPDSPL